MKTKTMLMCAAALAAIMCAACNNGNNGQSKELLEANIEPISMSAKDATFFDENMPYSNEALSLIHASGGCLAVNSIDGLRKVFPAPLKLPSINFENHTFIVGLQGVPGGNFKLTAQSINNGKNDITINLTIDMPEVYPETPDVVYYWGLYPKLPQKPISVKITYNVNGKPL